jgi:hypothetical protein
VERKMKKIIVSGAGGSPAVNFTRSLWLAPEKFHTIGTDCSKYYLQRAETDERYLIPLAHDYDYIKILNKIIDLTGAEFLHVQNDTEMEVISENREQLHCKTFLPNKNTVAICQNKLISHKLWVDAGVPQPKTFLVENADDLWEAWKTIDGELWIRDTTGAGGRGSLKTRYFKTAKSWINLCQGWGKFTVAECLTPRSTTWLSIWYKGKLIVAQERERLYWELNKLAPSGVTGATGTGVTVSNEVVTEISLLAIKAVDKSPHGIFSVDLTYDKNGVPNPTEINIGRFFTTHQFFAEAGLNVAYILVKLAFGETLEPLSKRINPLPNGLAWIRGMDFEPILTTIDKINAPEKVLEEMRRG